MIYKTRKQAREDGDHKYHTGLRCGRGHHAFRYTRTGNCVPCTINHKKYAPKDGKQTLRVRTYAQNFPLINEFVRNINIAVEITEIEKGR